MLLGECKIKKGKRQECLNNSLVHLPHTGTSQSLIAFALLQQTTQQVNHAPMHCYSSKLISLIHCQGPSRGKHLCKQTQLSTFFRSDSKAKDPSKMITGHLVVFCK